MLFYGARNETAEEIRNVIGYKFANVKDDEPQSYFQKFLKELDNNSDSYTLTCANTAASDKAFKVKKEYISLLEEYFKAFFQEVDFSNETEKAVKLLNE
ncbi:putative serpin-like protein TK1782 [Caerostris extrusa]|uniref:Serpin-like protein TK1782 n=1 Tax=Caerostris extrusa TaxID=172846 RepID=A0AAV4MCA8_CAEEX|nr:putative serpin-like protein TK1782 [Caerostris extrusa]